MSETLREIFMTLCISGLSAVLVIGSLLVLTRMSRYSEIQGFSLRHRLWLYGFSIAISTFGVAQILVAISKDVFSVQELILTTALAAIVLLIALAPVIAIWPSRKQLEIRGSTSALVSLDVLGEDTKSSEPDAIDAPIQDRETPDPDNLLSELLRIIRRFERALSGSKITIFTQDRDLSYTWIHNAPPGFGAATVIGQKDHEILPLETALPLIEAKRRALDEEQSERLETTITIEDVPHIYEVSIEPMYDEQGKLDGIISIAVDHTEQKAAESRLRLMMRELNHRSKNLLAVIQAIARQTATHASSPDGFVESFVSRLQGLAQSHDLLVHEAWRGGSLIDLINGQIGHQLHAKKSQIILVGKNLRLSVDATQHIGLALHELATNAAKYGALSVPEGKVKICWRKNQDKDGATYLRLRWSESGGPLVTPQSKKGFGHTILQKITAQALDAEVDTEFAPEGLSWELRLPWQHIVE